MKKETTFLERYGIFVAFYYLWSSYYKKVELGWSDIIMNWAILLGLTKLRNSIETDHEISLSIF